MANQVGGTIVWVLDVDDSKFNAGIAKATGNTAAFSGQLKTLDFQSVSKAAEKSFGSIADGLGTILKIGSVAGLGIATGLGLASKAAFDQVGAVQQATVALNAYEKDGTKVNKVLADLVAFARSDLGVLFNRKDLFASAQSLLVMGDATQNLTAHVEILARSVGLGLSTFEDLNRIVGRVGSTGRLAGDDFDNLTKAGFRLDDSLRNTDITFDQLFSALDKGIPIEALNGQANTIEGLTVKLNTAFRGVGEAILGVNSDTGQFIAGGLGDQLIGLFTTLRNTLKDPALLASLKTLGVNIGNFAKDAIPAILEGFKFFVANAQTIGSAFLAIAAGFVVAKIAAIGFGIASAIALSPFEAIVFIIAGAITALVIALTFLQVRFGLFTPILKGIQDGFQALQPVFKIIGGVIGELINNIGKLAAEIGKSLAPVFEFISQHAEVFKIILLSLVAVVFAPLIAGVVAIVVGLKILSVVIGFVADHFELFRNILLVILAVAFPALVAGIAIIIAIVRNWGTITSVVGGAISTTFKLIGSVFVVVVKAISGFWTGVLLPVLTAIGTVITTVLGIWIKVWAFILLVVIGTISIIVSTIYNILAPIAVFIYEQVLKPIYNGFVTVFSLLVGVVQLYFNLVYTYIVTPIVDAVTFIFGVLTSAITTVAGIVGGIANAIGSAFKVAYTFVANIVGDIYGVISGTFGKVITFLGGIGSKIVGAIGNFGGLLYDKGKDLIQGLLDGAGSLLTQIGKFFLDKVPGFIKEPFKKALGISSPSKVFAGYGVNIAEGLVRGLSSSESMVKGAVTGISDLIGVDASTTFGAPNISTGVGTSTAGSTGTTINQTNNIFQPVDLDLANRELGWKLANA